MIEIIDRGDLHLRLHEVAEEVRAAEAAGEAAAARAVEARRAVAAADPEAREEAAAAAREAEAEAEAATVPPALEREHLELLLRLLIGGPVGARARCRPAIDNIIRALRGRWPDEPDPDPARLDRVREIARDLPPVV